MNDARSSTGLAEAPVPVLPGPLRERLLSSRPCSPRAQEVGAAFTRRGLSLSSAAASPLPAWGPHPLPPQGAPVTPRSAWSSATPQSGAPAASSSQERKPPSFSQDWFPPSVISVTSSESFHYSPTNNLFFDHSQQN